ncbi:MAG: hypothetical protein FWB78_02825, partial [Treponema sp.]|nr:hypothetical protein [Treponema sp.]
MKKTGVIFGIALLVLILFSAGCAEQQRRVAAAPAPPVEIPVLDVIGPYTTPGMTLPDGLVSAVFIEDSDGTDDGVLRLIRSMQNHGLHFYQTATTPHGLIAPGDVVLLKINAQWDQRGGTNTDLIRGVIREILNHPGGFSGEIIVADNGQAQFGSFGRGGSLEWTLNNAEDTSQSTMDVIRYFRAMG